jgi:hypothetical protein
MLLPLPVLLDKKRTVPHPLCPLILQQLLLLLLVVAGAEARQESLPREGWSMAGLFSSLLGVRTDSSLIRQAEEFLTF